MRFRSNHNSWAVSPLASVWIDHGAHFGVRIGEPYSLAAAIGLARQDLHHGKLAAAAFLQPAFATTPIFPGVCFEKSHPGLTSPAFRQMQIRVNFFWVGRGVIQRHLDEGGWTVHVCLAAAFTLPE